MKAFMTRITLTLVIVALASVSAFSKTKTRTVTFDRSIKVNGTVLDKGKYDVKFDDKTAQLSILNNGKVVAQATTSIEKRQKKARSFEMRFDVSGNDKQLVAVTFAGTDQNIMLNSSAASR